jgi:hypothetical protein
MRATIRDLLIADTSLTALVPTERWFEPGAVIDVPEKPFVVLRWIAPVASNASGAFLHQLRIDAHDDRGNYGRIEALLGGPYRSGGIYPHLTGIMGLTGSDGYVAQADYLGDSGDQEDEEYLTNYKFSSWQIAGRSL